MTKLRASITMSTDGYVAGPNQSEDDPLGEGGMGLHDWAFPLAAWREPHGMEGGEVNASTPVVERSLRDLGAMIMGRNMFGPVRGGWDSENPWDGWWGEDPPFHVPVFVLTHHERETLEMKGGTTFTFVTDGIESALEQAGNAAGERDVGIAGGASTIQQYLAAGLVDELMVSIVPKLLGDGERLFANLGDRPPELELVETIEAPGVAHLIYRPAG
jgi:dihydrofolate reductase